MKPYLDTEDTFYFNYEELIKASKIITNLVEPKAELDPKQKKDYAGLGAIIFTFFLIAIVTALTIYTAYQIAYGSDLKPNWSEPLLERCVHSNITYSYMRLSNATECDGIVKWHDTNNWKFVTETNGEIVLTFENNMTAKEKAFEEGIMENK
jgi:hypothetical protein